LTQILTEEIPFWDRFIVFQVFEMIIFKHETSAYNWGESIFLSSKASWGFYNTSLKKSLFFYTLPQLGYE
jgi:hypothetical protein